jgi:hypothetical protein
MRKRISVSVLTIVLLFSLGCQRSATAPVSVIDRIGHTINIADALLNSATNFYSVQRQACSTAEATCRFSTSGLESYRISLLRANTSFRQATTIYELWRVGEATQSEVEAELTTLNGSILIVRSSCGQECE